MYTALYNTGGVHTCDRARWSKKSKIIVGVVRWIPPPAPRRQGRDVDVLPLHCCTPPQPRVIPRPRKSRRTPGETTAPPERCCRSRAVVLCCNNSKHDAQARAESPLCLFTADTICASCTKRLCSLAARVLPRLLRPSPFARQVCHKRKKHKSASRPDVCCQQPCPWFRRAFLKPSYFFLPSLSTTDPAPLSIHQYHLLLPHKDGITRVSGHRDEALVVRGPRCLAVVPAGSPGF